MQATCPTPQFYQLTAKIDNGSFALEALLTDVLREGYKYTDKSPSAEGFRNIEMLWNIDAKLT